MGDCSNGAHITINHYATCLPSTHTQNLILHIEHLIYLKTFDCNLQSAVCSLRSSTKRSQLAALINEYDIDIIICRESHHISLNVAFVYCKLGLIPNDYVIYKTI